MYSIVVVVVDTLCSLKNHEEEDRAIPLRPSSALVLTPLCISRLPGEAPKLMSF